MKKYFWGTLTLVSGFLVGVIVTSLSAYLLGYMGEDTFTVVFKTIVATVVICAVSFSLAWILAVNWERISSFFQRNWTGIKEFLKRLLKYVCITTIVIGGLLLMIRLVSSMEINGSEFGNGATTALWWVLGFIILFFVVIAVIKHGETMKNKIRAGADSVKESISPKILVLPITIIAFNVLVFVFNREMFWGMMKSGYYWWGIVFVILAFVMAYVVSGGWGKFLWLILMTVAVCLFFAGMEKKYSKPEDGKASTSDKSIDPNQFVEYTITGKVYRIPKKEIKVLRVTPGEWSPKIVSPFGFGKRVVVKVYSEKILIAVNGRTDRPIEYGRSRKDLDLGNQVETWQFKAIGEPTEVHYFFIPTE